MPNPRTRLARPSSLVMKPRMMWAIIENDGHTVAFSDKSDANDFRRSGDVMREVLAIDASPAGQEWLVEEVAKVVEDERKPRPFCRDCADNNGVCPHTRRYCDPNKQTAFAILARLTALAKGANNPDQIRPSNQGQSAER